MIRGVARNVTKRQFTFGLGSAALSLTLSRRALSQSQARMEFRGLLSSGLITFDPHRVMSDTDLIIHSVVYEGLVRMRFPQVLPGLATTWSADERQRRWRFSLRNALFHNGRNVTSKDVIFSLNRVMSDAQYAMHDILVARIAEIDALDERTVQIALHQPGESFLSDLALGSRCAIIPSEAVGADGSMRSPIGSGQYILNQFEEKIVRLSKFDSYHDGDTASLADDVILQPEPDAGRRIQRLERKEVDWIYSVPLGEVGRLQESGGVEIGSFDNGNVFRLVFNHTRTPFSDVQARRAVAAAVNREAINKAVFSGLATPQTQPFPEISPLRLAENFQVMSATDAKEIVAALTPQQRTITAIRQSGSDETLWNELTSQLEGVGFTVVVNVIDDESEAYQRVKSLDYDLVVFNESHPYDWFRVFGYYDERNVGNVWVGGYKNSRISSLLAQDKVEGIEGVRARYQSVFDLLSEDAATVYLFSVPVTHAWRAGDKIAAATGLAMVRDADP